MKYYSEIDFVFLNLSETIKKTDTEAWVNVNSKGAGNILHSHKGVSFACVYYLQSKDTGNLVFSNPANILSYDCHDLSPFVHSKIVAPDDGDLIMWPSWVPHLVEPNMSDKDRINFLDHILLIYILQGLPCHSQEFPASRFSYRFHIPSLCKKYMIHPFQHWVL